MHIEQLVTMVNDIANFFHGASEPGQAPRSVAEHLRRFWDPRMRRQLLEHYRAGGEGLNEIGRTGVGILAAAPTSTAAPGASSTMESG